MKYAIAILLMAAVLSAGCIGQSSAPSGGAVIEKPYDGQIIEFYGAECPHCQNMAPVVVQVEQDLGISITKLEVWHNDTNRATMTSYKSAITSFCGGSFGVPAFVDTKTGRATCGEMSADQLKAFIVG